MVQLSPRIENFGPGDQSWLGSRHGVENAITVTIDASAAASKVVDGYLKSGEALALNTSTGKYQPYASGGSNGTNVLAGFLIADVPLVSYPGDPGSSSDITAAMGVHLFVRTSKLPSSIGTSPTTSGLFVFLP